MVADEYSAERDTPASRAAARERNEEFRKRQAEVGMAFDYGRLLEANKLTYGLITRREHNG